VKLWLIKILRKLRLLKLFNLQVKYGQFQIPLLGELGLTHFNTSEKWMAQMLPKLLEKHKGSFVDVGVNVGQTLLKVKKLSPEISYIGFEPNPTCIYYLEKLIAHNKISNTQIIPVGLAESTYVAQLQQYYADSTDSSASIVANFRPSQQVVHTKQIVVLGEKDLELKEKTGIIKIDVEGAEWPVLQSLQKIILRDKPAIIIEILPAYKAENTNRVHNQKEIEKFMSKMGYKIFRIVKKADGTFDSFMPLKEIGIHENLNWCDYLMVGSGL
jgi:FkbM family methyltransferase